MGNEIERTLCEVEKLLVKYGAKPLPEEESGKFGLRGTFVLNSVYYRVEADHFEEGTAIVLTATDDPKLARFGLEDNIAGFRADLSPDRIEKEVRYALGLEPYPEDYPKENP